MKTKIIAITLLASSFSLISAATTWDEPWMHTVITNADAFVRVDVVTNTPSGFSATISKQLAGNKLSGEIDVTGYSLLKIGSTHSGSRETNFRFNAELDYYLFLKKSEQEGEYSIATPSTGWAKVIPSGVNATYRLSCHQALVPEDVYELSMTAIFNKLHGISSDNSEAISFMKTHLSNSPSLLSKSNGNKEILNEFFLQHVALELFRYFGSPSDISLIDPFLSADDFHTQISAVRAISRINSEDSKKRLMEFIESERTGFAKIMAIWGLDYLDATEYKARLKLFIKEGEDEETGLGVNIMDPIIGTRFPGSVKEAVKNLLQEWEK